MLISELQEILAEKKKEYGDIDIEYAYNDEGYMLTGSTSVNAVDVECSNVETQDSEGNPIRKDIYYLVLY